MQLIGAEGALGSALAPTLQEAKGLKIYTQAQALDYIGARPLSTQKFFWPLEVTAHKLQDSLKIGFRAHVLHY